MGRMLKNPGAGRFIQKMTTGVNTPRAALQATWGDTDDDGNDLGKATMRTVSFNLRGNPSATSVPIKCEALIVFSIDGNSITRRVSVVNGNSISAVAEAIDITLFDKTTDPGFPGALGEEYDVDIITAPGGRTFGHQPPILQPQEIIQTITSGTNHTFPIPPDAGVVAVFISATLTSGPPANGNITITEGSNGFGTRQWDANQYETWVPVSPGATEIVVANSALVSALVTVTFGVDG